MTFTWAFFVSATKQIRRLGMTLTPLLVIATLPPAAHAACTITAIPVTFEPYDIVIPQSTQAVGWIRYHCDPNDTHVTIALLSHDQHTTRRMTKGPHAITYTLYQDAAHTIIWGNGHGVGQLFRAPTPPLNTTITIPVYGQISPPQTGEAGIYLNQVQAVISWTPGPK